MNKKYLGIAGLTAVTVSIVGIVANSFALMPNLDEGEILRDVRPLKVEEMSLDDIAWSDENLSKFLANEKLVSDYIESQNSNIKLFLDLAKGINVNGWDVEYSEDEPYIVGIKEFVATLENGRITNAEELLAALKVLQIPPKIMP